MADEFQVGDLAVCVDDSPCRETPYPGCPFGLSKGAVFRVTAAWIDPEDGIQGLNLMGVRNEQDGLFAGYSAHRFQKLPPASPEFISLIRSLSPGRVTEDA